MVDSGRGAIVAVIDLSIKTSSILSRVRHHLQLHDAAVLFLLQVFAPLLDVDVVPRQHFAHWPGALRVPCRINAKVGERLPPEIRLEALGPAVKPAAAAPGFFE